MAKLIVTEVLEGTNKQIKEMQEKLSRKLADSTKAYKEQYGDMFSGATIEVTLDEVKETPLQQQLRSELESIRPMLSEDLIRKAEALIASFGEQQDTEEEVDDEDFDECDEEDDDDYDFEDEDENFFDGDEGYHIDEDGDCVLNEETDAEAIDFLIRVILG